MTYGYDFRVQLPCVLGARIALSCLLTVEEQHDLTEIIMLHCIEPKSSSPSWDRLVLEAHTVLRVTTTTCVRF